jgi:hypothetical protein
MLSYKEYDNAQAVEIVLAGRVSTEEFDALAGRLEAFIARHGIKFSLRHLKDVSRVAIVANPDTHHLWSSLVAPCMACEVEHFAPGEEDAARDWLMWPEGAADI